MKDHSSDTQLRYRLVVSRGYVQLVRKGRRQPRRFEDYRFVRRDRHWLPASPGDDDVADTDDDWIVPDDDTDAWPADEIAPDPDEDIPDEALHPCRGDRGLSRRSRQNMRRLFVSLPWELVGSRPALISLTYPGLWQPWVINGRVWGAHRRAFERRWVRRWKEPLVGVWVKEFQSAGRPHLHLYVGLPTAVSGEDFAYLRDRTIQRHQLEHKYGQYDGRKRTPPVAIGDYGSEFGRWLLDTWSQVVGTDRDEAWQRALDEKGTDHHRTRGGDLAVMFWSDEAEAGTDRTRVAQYLAAEAGKIAQKQPANGFGRIGRYYGVWGRSVGFEPEFTITPISGPVAAEVEARLTRWVHWKLAVRRRGLQPTNRLALRRPGDGVTAFGLGPEQAARILVWSEKAAARRLANNCPRRAGAAGPGALLKLLRSLDVASVAVPSPEPIPVEGQ